MSPNELRDEATEWSRRTGLKPRLVRLTQQEHDDLAAMLGADATTVQRVDGMHIRVVTFMPPAGRFAGTADNNVAREPLVAWRKWPKSNAEVLRVRVGDAWAVAGMVGDKGWVAWGRDARIVGTGAEVAAAARERVANKVRVAWEGVE